MKTKIQRIEPGLRISEAVVYGDRIYSAGIVADATLGKSVYEQTKEILQQIDTILAQAGSDKTKILKANIWLASMTTFDQMNKAWDEWVVPKQAPARATVQSQLVANYLVEIMIEAVI